MASVFRGGPLKRPVSVKEVKLIFAHLSPVLTSDYITPGNLNFIKKKPNTRKPSTRRRQSHLSSPLSVTSPPASGPVGCSAAPPVGLLPLSYSSLRPPCLADEPSCPPHQCLPRRLWCGRAEIWWRASALGEIPLVRARAAQDLVAPARADRDLVASVSPLWLRCSRKALSGGGGSTGPSPLVAARVPSVANLDGISNYLLLLRWLRLQLPTLGCQLQKCPRK